MDDTDYAAVLGKRGMNARLIGLLLGYELEVQRMSEYNKSIEIQRFQLAESTDPALDAPLELPGVKNKLIVQNVVQAGYDTLRKLLQLSVADLANVPGISLDMAYKILEEASKLRSE